MFANYFKTLTPRLGKPSTPPDSATWTHYLAAEIALPL
jgi:hypothetical protein